MASDTRLINAEEPFSSFVPCAIGMPALSNDLAHYAPPTAITQDLDNRTAVNATEGVPVPAIYLLDQETH